MDEQALRLFEVPEVVQRGAHDGQCAAHLVCGAPRLSKREGLAPGCRNAPRSKLSRVNTLAAKLYGRRPCSSAVSPDPVGLEYTIVAVTCFLVVASGGC